ncbi:MAG: S9 family peptidase [bacterium]
MTKKSLTRQLIILMSLLTITVLTAQEKRSMNFTDVVNLKRVSSPRLSPNGDQLLFTMSEACWKDNKYISHIYRIQTDGTGLVQMTNGKDGESGGYWSPDGKTIAFISKRGADDSQIFFLNNSGGEAIQFTKHEGDIHSLQWSPDGKQIYFSATDPLTAEEKKKKEKKDDAFLFEQNWKPRHLWVIDVKSKEEKKLTDGDFSIQSFNLSRDDSKIVYSKAPTPLYDDVLKAEIWLMNLKDKSKKQITNNEVYETSIELSPDNKHILFVSDSDKELDETYFQGALFIVPVKGGTPELILPDFTPEIYGATWSADGNHIYFTANMGVHVEIFSLNMKNRNTTQLTEGMHSFYGFDYIPEINHIAYIVNTPNNPGKLWIANMELFTSKMVYNPYLKDLESFELAKYEVIEWKGEDGYPVEGILIYPIDYQKGKRYPLLAHTHGGPAASDKMGFDGYAHARAGRGYAILKPNYRGSTGYGNKVLRDMVGHYFHQADGDVLTGVDYLIEKGIADPDKLGTMGWSAGGHMTNWLITVTDRFKAASSGAGASNWISMYAQSDVRIYRTPWFLGDPWHEDSPLDTYRAHSPIFRIHEATTPTLILVGENDKRVPMPQSVELYRGLKANGVPTELVVFPRSGHGPRELLHRLYRMNKQFQWLEKYIRDKEFTFDEPPLVEENDKSMKDKR